MSHADMEAEEPEWTKANVQKLLAAMKSIIPESERTIAYTQGVKTLDWEKVAFPPFSPEECEQKWREIFLKMRKVRSLTELIVEAEEVISDPLKNQKIHPAFPKRPRPATAIYFSENYSKLRKQHPGMKNSALMKIAIKQFKGLSDKKKAPYVDKFKNLFKEYTEKKLELREKYEISSRKCRRTTAVLENTSAVELHKDEGGLPPKPPVSGYILFCKEMSEKEDIPKKSYIREWSQRWRNLSEKERSAYIKRCTELKNQYATKLRNYLMMFDEDKQHQILHENKLTIPLMHKQSDKTSKKLLPGEPKKPSTCAHISFWQEQMQLLKKEIPNSKDRFVVISKLWQQLPVKEKEQYKLKMHEKLKKYSMELKKWFKTLTADEQVEYRNRNSEKLKFLDQMHVNVCDSELYLKQPSDSEDEATDDSSSDNEYQNALDWNEEDDQEEEEDDDVIFDMYL